MLQQSTPISLLVGLGNPGAEYVGTRHNAGFDVIGRLLERLPGRFSRIERYGSVCFQGRFRGRNLILQLPQTYMNASGRAVSALLRDRNISTEEMLVISDDLDLPLGRLRIRIAGSSGGHRGLESILTETGNGEFSRLRIGIGRDDGEDAADYVLGRMDSSERCIYEKVLDAAADATLTVLGRGIVSAMNRYNGWRAEVRDFDDGKLREN